MELKIEDDQGLLLWLGPDDLVQVPMDLEERAQCRKALLDALDLLDQTIVKWSISSMASGMDGCEIQTSQYHPDCLAAFDFSHPSKQRADNQEPKLRLVSALPPKTGC